MLALVEKVNLSVEEELRMYKDLVSKIPYKFKYSNADLGVSISKERSEEKIDIAYDDPEVDNLEFKLTPHLDLSMTEVENFIAPILDHVPHHITFIDSEGKVTFCNKRAATDLGTIPEKVVGKHIRELLELPDDQIAMLKTLETGKVLQKSEVLDKNYGILNTMILNNEDGEIERVVGCFEWLNSVKESEKNAITGRIAAGIAHEVRNPLTTIKGFLQLYREQLDKNSNGLISSLLIPELDRANKIITDFLTVAKPSPLESEKKDININSFLSDFIGNLLYSESMINNVTMKYDLDEALEKVSSKINRDEIVQVFLNLFKNSVEAAEGKPLNIRIKSERLDDKVKISFVDNGPGIPPTVKALLFDPFFTTKDEGTGLGLSVSRKIIENHNGKMEVKSKIGLGSTFTIELPVS